MTSCSFFQSSKTSPTNTTPIRSIANSTINCSESLKKYTSTSDHTLSESTENNYNWRSELTTSQDSQPYAAFTDDATTLFLKPSHSTDDYINKARSLFFNKEIYRGQTIHRSLTLNELIDFFITPNKILISKNQRIQSSDLNVTYSVEKLDDDKISNFKSYLPKYFNSVIQDHLLVQNLISTHISSSASTALISFTSEKRIAEKFINRKVDLIFTVLLPKFGSIDHSSFDQQFRSKTSWIFNEKEFLIYGIVDPDSILKIEYVDYGLQKKFILERNSNNPCKLTVLNQSKE